MSFLLLLLTAIAVILIANIKVVAQSNVYVVERLGKYLTSWDAGLHVKVPFIDTISKKVSIKEQVGDFPPQPVITKDNVTIQIDTVVYYTVFDPKLYVYGVNNPIQALGMLTATTLRNIIGELDLDGTLTSRDVINSKMCQILDQATDAWGIKVNRVELKNIMPPRDIQEAMEKQMRAEREKRQTLLEAEAHKESSVLRAEGDKASAILHAEAERDAAIARATGEAESIRLKYNAEAEGLERLASVELNDGLLTLRKLEALKALGDGRATKLVVPTELASVTTQLSTVGELLNITKDIDKSPKEVVVPKQKDDCCDKPESSKVTKEFVE